MTNMRVRAYRVATEGEDWSVEFNATCATSDCVWRQAREEMEETFGFRDVTCWEEMRRDPRNHKEQDMEKALETAWEALSEEEREEFFRTGATRVVGGKGDAARSLLGFAELKVIGPNEIAALYQMAREHTDDPKEQEGIVRSYMHGYLGCGPIKKSAQP